MENVVELEQETEWRSEVARAIDPGENFLWHCALGLIAVLGEVAGELTRERREGAEVDRDRLVDLWGDIEWCTTALDLVIDSGDAVDQALLDGVDRVWWAMHDAVCERLGMSPDDLKAASRSVCKAKLCHRYPDGFARGAKEEAP